MKFIDENIAEDIQVLKKYCNTADYLTVAQMYLLGNVLLNKPLYKYDLKERPTGHWGVSPGLNFLYANLNYFVKKYNDNIFIIIGTGHAGSALLSNLFLDGTLSKFYPNINFSEQGLKNLVNINSKFGVRSEISPYIPGTIYDGGELGYSLGVAFGSVLGKKDIIATCIIGDGELETGTLAASWNSIKLLDPINDGIVFPIINFNGFKMGNESLFSKFSDKEKVEYFTGLGYEPYIVNNDIERLQNILQLIHYKWLDYKTQKTKRLPMIIFTSPKGWTAPICANFDFSGKVESHKSPLKNPRRNQVEKEYLKKWLKKYKKDYLMLSDSSISDDIKKIIPLGHNSISSNSINAMNQITYELCLPEISRYTYNINERNKTKVINIEMLDNYLCDVCVHNTNIKIISPDELKSNGFVKLSNNENLRNSVLEILSENVCMAWMQGYVQMGGHAIMISYEAFMPIISSMIFQYAKFIKQSEKILWRKTKASLNFIVTSLCWSNVYSHQNPIIINELIDSGYDFIDVFFPADSNELIYCVDYCLKSSNKINLIIASKGERRQWISTKNARRSITKGINIWEWISDCIDEPDIVISVCGDCIVEEAIEAVLFIKKFFPKIRIRFVYITRINILCKDNKPLSLNDEEFIDYFGEESLIVFIFHGYISVIKSLLYERNVQNRIVLFGYSNEGDYSSNEKTKLFLNQISKYYIIQEVNEFLLKRGKISKKTYGCIKNKLTEIFNSES